jgi:hypothetical protein
MSRRPARATEAELRRVIAAAKKAGARAVSFYDGAATVHLDAAPSTVPNQMPSDNASTSWDDA